MKLEDFLDSKPPGWYNRPARGSTVPYWQCLRQRKAWLLQRWLRGKDGEPFFYFFELKTPLYVSAEKELEHLFNNPHKYQVRYAGETYWVVWKHLDLYFILNVNQFNFDFPNSFNTDMYQQAQLAVTAFLALIQQNDNNLEMITRLCGGKTINTWASTDLIYCELEDGTENLLFRNYRKNYRIPLQPLLEWVSHLA